MPALIGSVSRTPAEAEYIAAYVEHQEALRRADIAKAKLDRAEAKLEQERRRPR